MKIVALDVQNVKRIRAVHVEPDGSVVILGGQNEQGKTSVLDSIMMALAGGRAIPGMPLHRGEKKGHVKIDLGEVVVTRTFTEGGGGSLTVEAQAAGGTVRVQSPQAWLDARIGAMSFDPLEFMRQRPRDQAETMRRLVGVDTTALDTERADVFARRTDLNRQVRDAEGAARDMPHYPNAPDAPVSTEDLTARLDRARRANETRRDAERRAEDTAREHRAAVAALERFDDQRPSRRASAERAVEGARAEILRLEDLLARARDALQSAEGDLAGFDQQDASERERMQGEVGRLETAASQLAAAADDLPTVDEAAILARFGDIEAVNTQVRANVARAEAEARAEALRVQSRALTDRLEAIDAEKARMIAAATFPVPGLSFGEDGGVTYQGVPLDQTSGAERIRISMAVALAMNPELRVVLIRDASLLDAHSMQIVAEMAAERDAQVWLERVGDGDPGAVVIEDGCVLAGETAGPEGGLL